MDERETRMTATEQAYGRRLRASVVNGLHEPAARLAGLHRLRRRKTSRQAVFTRIYDSAGWESTESGSGTGSELRATGEIRERLPDLLSRIGATGRPLGRPR